MGIGLSGKSVIVTGAATGVGLAVAQRFAEAGAKVTMVDADEDLLESEAAAINETEPEGEAQTFHGSVEEKLCMTNLIATAIGSYDSIDVLVNANRMLYSAKPLESEAEKFEAILSENVIANFRLSRMVALRMMEIEEASDFETPPDRAIINLSSIQARRAVPELLAYSVSCAALDQLTRTMAGTLAPNGIRVNAIAVGGIPGQSMENALPGVDDISESMEKIIPLGRRGETRDAANAALFLASPAASFITGQVLGVDGGRLLYDPLAGQIS